MKVIKRVDNFNRYYSSFVKTVSEDDRLLLDKAMSVEIFHNQGLIKYPNFHRGDVFKLPFDEFFISKYENAFFETIGSIGYYSAGNKINVLKENENGVFDFDNVYSALSFGGDTWQHTMQDVLPMIYFGRDLLRKNPDISVLLYELKSQGEKEIVDFLFKALGIKNEKVFIPYLVERKLKAKNLYIMHTDTITPCFWWPNFFYQGINRFLEDRQNNARNNVILIRRFNSRRVVNHDRLLLIARKYCDINNLNLIDFCAEMYPNFHDRVKIFQNAHTVIAPHGGANYHLLFSSENTKFIEFCGAPTSMFTIYNIASALNLNYYILPYLGDNSTSSVLVDVKKLEKALFE